MAKVKLNRFLHRGSLRGLIVLALSVSGISSKNECLTGRFTDVQHWAQHDGSLNPNLNASHALDLSAQPDALSQLRILMGRGSYHTQITIKEENSELMSNDDYGRDDKHSEWIYLKNVYYLSLAQNELDRIPLFYNNASGVTGSNWYHLKYLSLYGNDFHNPEGIRSQLQYTAELNASIWEEMTPRHFFSYSKVRSNWASDLLHLNLNNLLELDMRNCSIEILFHDTFHSLTNLRRLYLAENNIFRIDSEAFKGLSNLVHLDISDNVLIEFVNETDFREGLNIAKDAFKPLIKLKSLDLSYTKITQSCIRVFEELTSSVERMSLCYTRFPFSEKGLFAKMSLKYLDISGNIALEQINHEAFKGMENSLEILYAKQMGIKNLLPFKNLKKLKVLTLTENDINTVDTSGMHDLTELVILDLSDNRITNWIAKTFNSQNKLELLRVDKNNLNLMSIEMLEDFNTLKFLSLGDNSFVCNCNVRGFIDRIVEIEQHPSYQSYPSWYVNLSKTDHQGYALESEQIDFNNAYLSYSMLIDKLDFQHEAASSFQLDDDIDQLETEGLLNFTHNFTFRLLDFHDREYQCVDSKSSKPKPFLSVPECTASELGFPVENTGSLTALVLGLIAIAIIVIMVVLVIWKWWYVRYFFLMMKNIAVLSVLGKEQQNEGDPDKIFNYDVFVSYCDEDREWVLNEFIPHVEEKSNVCVCLHERDFEVGLSILENIISCMDRSRALLLVISNQFLMSSWCQFEMHLAQHRLIETRREQLILVLLEEIPRRKRPNTLHYLMMTKTYIVWPKVESERETFWRRLMKSIMHGKQFTHNKHSLA